MLILRHRSAVAYNTKTSLGDLSDRHLRHAASALHKVNLLKRIAHSGRFEGGFRVARPPRQARYAMWQHHLPN